MAVGLTSYGRTSAITAEVAYEKFKEIGRRRTRPPSAAWENRKMVKVARHVPPEAEKRGEAAMARGASND